MDEDPLCWLRKRMRWLALDLGLLHYAEAEGKRRAPAPASHLPKKKKCSNSSGFCSLSVVCTSGQGNRPIKHDVQSYFPDLTPVHNLYPSLLPRAPRLTRDALPSTATQLHQCCRTARTASGVGLVGRRAIAAHWHNHRRRESVLRGR